MMKILSKRLLLTGSCLGLALIGGPRAEAASHLNAVSAKAVTAPGNLTPGDFAGGKNHYAAFVSRAQFVNKLLNEEKAAISRNTTLLNQRTGLENRLFRLESEHPTTPQQIRLLNAQIRSTTGSLNSVQNALNANLVHLNATIPGIESSIALALTQIQTLAPFCPQAIKFGATATVGEERNAAALDRIIREIPVSP